MTAYSPKRGPELIRAEDGYDTRKAWFISRTIVARSVFGAAAAVLAAGVAVGGVALEKAGQKLPPLARELYGQSYMPDHERPNPCDELRHPTNIGTNFNRVMVARGLQDGDFVTTALCEGIKSNGEPGRVRISFPNRSAKKAL